MKKKRNTKSASKIVDVILLVVCLAGIGFSLYWFKNLLFLSLANDTDVPIGTVTFKKRSPRRRVIHEEVWEYLNLDSTIYEGDYIITETASEAQINFTGEAADDLGQTEIHPNSIIQATGLAKTKFVSGSITLTSGNQSKLVQFGDKLFYLEENSQAIISMSSIDTEDGSQEVTVYVPKGTGYYVTQNEEVTNNDQIFLSNFTKQEEISEGNSGSVKIAAENIDVNKKQNTLPQPVQKVTQTISKVVENIQTPSRPAPGTDKTAPGTNVTAPSTDKAASETNSTPVEKAARFAVLMPPENYSITQNKNNLQPIPFVWTDEPEIKVDFSYTADFSQIKSTYNLSSQNKKGTITLDFAEPEEILYWRAIPVSNKKYTYVKGSILVNNPKDKVNNKVLEQSQNTKDLVTNEKSSENQVNKKTEPLQQESEPSISSPEIIKFDPVVASNNIKNDSSLNKINEIREAAQREKEERLRKEAEEKARAEEELRKRIEEEQKREAEAKAKAAEEKRKKEIAAKKAAEEKRKKQEQEALEKKKAEEKAKKEAERKKAEEAAKEKKRAEEEAAQAEKIKKQEEERRQKELQAALEKQRQEEQARKEAEEKARQEEEAAIKAAEEAKERARIVAEKAAEEKARAEREAAEKAAAQEQARIQEVERKKAEEAAKEKKRAEEEAAQAEKIKKQEEERRQKELQAALEKQRQEEQARKEAEEKARLEEEKLRLEEEAKAKAEQKAAAKAADLQKRITAFQISAPVIQNPSAGRVFKEDYFVVMENPAIVFQWAPVTSAQSYNFELKNSSGKTLLTKKLKNPKYTLSKEIELIGEDGTYFWTVSANTKFDGKEYLSEQSSSNFAVQLEEIDTAKLDTSNLIIE